MFKGNIWTDIIAKKVVIDKDGHEHPLHSDTSEEQCRFLQSLIQKIGATNCLEVGLAYGVSSMAICEAMTKIGGGNLISIDPFQEEHWKNIGLLNLERAGYRDQTNFYPALAEDVLPKLAASGTEIDFAYVDGSKVFDITLIQAHYLLRMLRVGGLLVFDDCAFPGLARAMRWFNTYPHLKLHATFGAVRRSFLRRATGKIVHCIPSSEKLFRSDLTCGEVGAALSFQCVCFEKISDDGRRYDWDLPL